MDLHTRNGLLNVCLTSSGCMTFFLRVLEIFRQLDDILHAGHKEEVAYLENACIGGQVFGIAVEGAKP
jgi:hypothetical protein